MNNFHTSTIIIFALLAAAVALNGCATADVLGAQALKYVFKPDPTVVKATVQVSTDANPDSRGRPSPVKTRFYLLKSASVFKSAGFFQLKEQDRELLSDDIMIREETVFKPGEEELMELNLPPEETPEEGKLHLGVMVGYWDIDHAQWRVVSEVEVQETTAVNIGIARSEVSIKVID